jgi:hypothetical protein
MPATTTEDVIAAIDTLITEQTGVRDAMAEQGADTTIFDIRLQVMRELKTMINNLGNASPGP